MTTVLDCYRLLEDECPLPFNKNVEFCYQSLRDAKRQNTGYSFKKYRKSGNSFDKYVTCMTRLHHQITPCITELEDSCKAAATRAIKTIRLDMSFVRQLLATEPAIRVVHLVRDPRGMLLSSRKMPNRVVDYSAASYICKRLWANINDILWLNRNFPGSSLEIRYEDLAMDLQEVSSAIYNHARISSKLKDGYLSTWLDKITSSSNNVGTFRTFRSNSSVEAYDWMTQLNTTERQIIESVPECVTIIEKLKYPKTLPKVRNFIDEIFDLKNLK